MDFIIKQNHINTSRGFHCIRINCKIIIITNKRVIWIYVKKINNNKYKTFIVIKTQTNSLIG